MNRVKAKQIAEVITNEQLFEMLKNAREQITDWTAVSKVNPSLTRGAAWNVLGKSFNCKRSYHILAVRNMVREFGEYAPEHIIPESSKKKVAEVVIHQTPDFSLFDALNAATVNPGADLVEVISAFLELKKSGKKLLGLCPFHPEKTPSFSVDPKSQVFHCFGCGATGDRDKFIALITQKGDDYKRRIL